jgi:hypothetical protein
MRKFIIPITTLGICGILSGEGWALPIQLGHHSVREIKQTCAGVGGDFFQDAGSGKYGCFHQCGEETCSVECSRNGQCIGDCPDCGGPDQPVVRGGANVTRVLNNFRTAKRYPAKRY